MNGLGRKKEKKQNKQAVKDSVLTKETLGVVLVLFATLSLVCLITRDAVFSVIGQKVNEFLLGCFGYFAYLVAIGVIIYGVLLIIGKQLKYSKKCKFLVTFFFCLVAFLSHAISMHSSSSLSYGEYLVNSYKMAAGGIATSSAGGLVTGLITYWLTYFLSNVGAYIILSILIALSVYLFVRNFIKPAKAIGASANEKKAEAIEEKAKLPVAPAVEQPAQSGEDIDEGPRVTEMSGDVREGLVQSIESVGRGESYSQARNREMQEKLDYILRPVSYEENQKTIEELGTKVSDYVTPREQKPAVEAPPLFEHTEEVLDDTLKRANDFSEKYVNVFDEAEGEESQQLERATEEQVIIPEEPEILSFNGEEIEVEEFAPVKPEPEGRFGFGSRLSERGQSSSLFEEPKKEEPEKAVEIPEEKPQADLSQERFGHSRLGERRSSTLGGEELFGGEKTETEKSFETPRRSYTSRVEADFNTSAQAQAPAAEEKPKKPAPPINRKYVRPPLDLLESHTPPAGAPKEDHQGRMSIIKQTLEEFRINVEPQSYIQGPTVTRYEIKMPAGISVKKVLGYDEDLRMYLESKSGIRIEAPIPGKNLVGIEVANKSRVTVGLRELLEGMQPSKPGTLMFAIGKDIVGNVKSDNLAKGPHFLVAGATGSGKSVCLNVMITSLIMRYSPEELRLILVDPKSVGFRIYEHIPHLLIDEIITDVPRTLAVLQWAYNEMERRYKVFADCGSISDIEAYNSRIANDQIPKLPRIVIVIDELADLMETNKREMESRIRALAQKSRAAGIHLVLATQRPSVDIITGTIKANLPSRIALRVMSIPDSQTILGESGAEKLLGNGDMLYKNSSMSECERYQGAWLSDSEIANIVKYIKEHNTAYFEDDVSEYLDRAVNPKQEETESSGAEGGGDESEINDLFLKSLWLGVTSGTMSISQLQRRFQIGYAKAGGLVDRMERMGFISGNEGSKARKVLLSREQFEERFGHIPDA